MMPRKSSLAPLLLGPLPPNTFRPPRGEKQVYLPNFTLTLLRTPHSPPNWASFLTPLWLNKLDLKDYLYNAYGLQALSIRSYVIQAKLQQEAPGGMRRGRWFRPRSTKKMTVELAEKGEGHGPFAWPREPVDYSPWQQADDEAVDNFEKSEKMRKRREGGWATKSDGGMIAKQAKALLAGKAKWRPGWADYGMGGVPGVGRDFVERQKEES